MKIDYVIEVRLLSAMHINGGTDSAGKRIMLMTDGKAYIPATVIKGYMRENFSKLWEQVNDESGISCIGKENAEKPCECMTCQMFGKGGFQRSRIYFDNLETEQELEYVTRCNISVDRHLRKAVDGALVFSQAVERYEKSNAFGKKAVPVVFSGDISVYYPVNLDIQKQKKIEAVLVEAVRMISYIGLGKSRGWGFVEADIKPKEGEWLCEKL